MVARRPTTTRLAWTDDPECRADLETEYAKSADEPSR
jgi:hypothetical protein